MYTYIVYLSITTRFAEDVWIGLNYSNTTGAVWMDGTTSVPSDIMETPRERDCVFMKTTPFNWHYGECSQQKMVICQGKSNIYLIWW